MMDAMPGIINDIASPMDLLHALQEEYGHIDEVGLAAIARAAGASAAELFGAVSAYPRFRLRPGSPTLAVCGGPACQFAGNSGVRDALGGVGTTHCLGLCDQPVAVLTGEGPQVAVQPTQLRPPGTPRPRVEVKESVFFGGPDPFDAVKDALECSPDDIIAKLTDSGLLGRGGAAFPTGRKWAAVQAAPGNQKFVVCNADESEPGTFKDRCLLDHEPRRVLAGMVLASHAIGARAGIIYIRYDFDSQYRRLLGEIEKLRGEGLLGHGFDVVVRRGAGLYICGEETALLNSLEGKRPIPRDRPPYPVTHGLYGAPTLVQNVETLAAVPAIISRGAAWYREAGSPKLYCASGDVPSPGVFELPLGVRAQDLLDLAGARPRDVKAFTLGGLSGGLLPASLLDMRLDFESPRGYDAYLGSGGLVVLGHSRCVVRFALEAMRFFADESCGKCFPCRIGAVRLRERLDMATRLQPMDGDVEDLIDTLTTGSACGLGPAAALIARHLLRHFADELEAHGRAICLASECQLTEA